jgi:AsmA-like C-terminal region
MENKQRPLILWVGVGVIAACCGLLLTAYFFAPVLKNAIERHAEGMLRAQFGAEVRFQSFEVTLFPRLHVLARGMLVGNDPAHPLIEATTVDAQSSVLPWHIRRLVLEGLSLHIPTAGGLGSPGQVTTSAVSVAEIVSANAHVEMLPSAGRHTPLRFELAHLRVQNFNPGHAAEFSAVVVSAEPRADIDASGRMGPWNALDPGLTPLEGMYTLAHCDLATLPGVKGLLSSQGRFQGVLQRIEIAGDAKVAQFSLSVSGHPEPLHASLQAIVNASDSSVTIAHLSGVLQNSPLVASGVVHDVQDDRLRDIALLATVDRGRLEDVVPLVVKSKTSPMSGALRWRGKLEILPGAEDILNRLRLDGDFDTPDARFSSLDLRQQLRNASRKAEGHPKDQAAGSSISSIQGHVRLDNGVAAFSDLAFDLEGASARLSGSYQLASERLDLHGDVWIDAKLSQTATGAKALLLKAAEPFFRSKSGGSRIPIKITGTRSNPQFALDIGAKTAATGSDGARVLFSH